MLLGERNRSAWDAIFQSMTGPRLYRVEIHRHAWAGRAWCYHTVATVGVWPGYASDDWIEYIPEGDTP